MIRMGQPDLIADVNQPFRVHINGEPMRTDRLDAGVAYNVRVAMALTGEHVADLGTATREQIFDLARRNRDNYTDPLYRVNVSAVAGSYATNSRQMELAFDSRSSN